MLAAQFNNIEITRVLLDTGTDVNQGSDVGWTTFHNSAIYDCNDAIRTLIQHEEPTTMSYTGEKPIDIARRMNGKKAIFMLQH